MGPLQVIALHQVGAQGAHRFVFRAGFHAFGDGAAAQGLGDFDDGFDELALGPVLVNALDEMPVDFDEIRVHLRPQGQAGIARPQVVQGHHEAHAAVVQQRGLHQVDVVDLVGFGDFDHHPPRIQPLRLQVLQGAAVDEILVQQRHGTDVDKQLARQSQPRESANHRFTAKEVQFQQPLLAGGGFEQEHRVVERRIGRAADQALVAVNFLPAGTYDGMENRG